MNKGLREESIVHNLSALKGAFMFYGGTLNTSSAMRRAWDCVEQGLTPNEDGTYTIAAEAWGRAMDIFHSLPYGGRWVWKARESFGYALKRAFTKEEETYAG